MREKRKQAPAVRRGPFRWRHRKAKPSLLEAEPGREPVKRGSRHADVVSAAGALAGTVRVCGWCECAGWVPHLPCAQFRGTFESACKEKETK